MFPIDLAAFAQAAGWSSLPTEVLGANLQATAVDPTFPGALLPAFDGKNTVWYAACANAQEWRSLRRLLLAYAGPTVSDFEGRAIAFDLGNPAERLLLEAGAASGARISTPPEHFPLATRALQRLVATHAQRPSGRNEVARSTQTLLARIEMCLVAGDRTAATGVLATLEREWRLDALNLRFLAVRIMAHFRDWEAIVRADWLAALTQARKPPAVAAAVLEALFHVHLEPHEGDADAQREVYNATVRSLALPLFGQVGSDVPIIKTYGLLERLSPKQESTDRISITQRRILAAAETDSVSVRRAALDELAALSDEDRQAAVVPAPVRAALELVAPGAILPPTDWLEWIELLGNPDATSAMEWAQTGAAEWLVTLWADPARATRLADALLAVPDGLAHERLALCLPILVRWVRSDLDFPRGSLRPLYDALLTQLLMLEARGQAEREAASDLFEALLAIGTSSKVYARLTEDIGGLIDGAAGQLTAYWSFDLVELVMRYPAPEPDSRIALLNRILAGLQSCISILTPAQQLSYDRVAASAGWPRLPSDRAPSRDSGLDSALRGKTVAIYTLTESAGRQAAAVLAQLSPSVNVELAHDHVASPRLERLAKKADMFVMVSGSAKHAATDCITRHRAGREIIYAAGRGFCSIVRAIESACAAR